MGKEPLPYPPISAASFSLFVFKEGMSEVERKAKVKSINTAETGRLKKT
jgi:hypothetical protein